MARYHAHRRAARAVTGRKGTKMDRHQEDETTTVAKHGLTSEQMEWLRAYARAVEFHDDQTVSLIRDSDYGDVTVRVSAGYALSFARMRVSEEIAVEYDEQPWEFCSPLAAERGEFWRHVTGFAPPGGDGWLAIDLGGNKALLATVECDMPEKLRITNGSMEISSVQGTMPKEIDGSLTISSLAASNLPTGTTVSGTLIVERTGYRLPDGLKVGNLVLSGFGRVELGDGTEIAGDLYLEGSGIRGLPNNLKVGGNIEFSEDGEFDRPCPITELPSGLFVGGDLDLRGSMIETVPDDAVVKGVIIDRHGQRIERIETGQRAPRSDEDDLGGPILIVQHQARDGLECWTADDWKDVARKIDAFDVRHTYTLAKLAEEYDREDFAEAFAIAEEHGAVTMTEYPGGVLEFHPPEEAPSLTDILGDWIGHDCRYSDVFESEQSVMDAVSRLPDDALEEAARIGWTKPLVARWTRDYNNGEAHIDELADLLTEHRIDIDAVRHLLPEADGEDGCRLMDAWFRFGDGDPILITHHGDALLRDGVGDLVAVEWDFVRGRIEHALDATDSAEEVDRLESWLMSATETDNVPTPEEIASFSMQASVGIGR